MRPLKANSNFNISFAFLKVSLNFAFEILFWHWPLVTRPGHHHHPMQPLWSRNLPRSHSTQTLPPWEAVGVCHPGQLSRSCHKLSRVHLIVSVRAIRHTTVLAAAPLIFAGLVLLLLYLVFKKRHSIRAFLLNFSKQAHQAPIKSVLKSTVQRDKKDIIANFWLWSKLVYLVFTKS